MSTVIEEKVDIDFSGLASEPFISVTTFRRDGTPVSTPVWCAGDIRAILVITEAGSGKVKRIRNNGHLRVAACSARGKVRGPSFDGNAILIEATERVESLLAMKYGWMWRGYRLSVVLRDALRRIRGQSPMSWTTLQITAG